MTKEQTRKWPWWKAALAYIALTALAAASIALVDRKVHDQPAETSPGPTGANDGNHASTH